MYTCINYMLIVIVDNNTIHDTIHNLIISRGGRGHGPRIYYKSMFGYMCLMMHTGLNNVHTCVCMYIYVYIYIYTHIHTSTNIVDYAPRWEGAWAEDGPAKDAGAAPPKSQLCAYIYIYISIT